MSYFLDGPAAGLQCPFNSKKVMVPAIDLVEWIPSYGWGCGFHEYENDGKGNYLYKRTHGEKQQARLRSN